LAEENEEPSTTFAKIDCGGEEERALFVSVHAFRVCLMASTHHVTLRVLASIFISFLPDLDLIPSYHQIDLMSVSVGSQSVAEFLSSVLPVSGNSRLEDEFQRPLVTLTFAQSIDGKIAGKEGKQLILSGKESMLMTHWYDLI
jgi:hypothetical protein